MWNKIKSSPFIRTVFFALVSVVLSIIIVLVWLNFYTNHGEKIETPSFIGLSLEEASEIAETNGLRLSIDSVFSSHPKNTIILQNPVAHTDSTESWVKGNRIIYLTIVRNSIQKVKVPDVVDNSKSLASTKLTIAGLSPKWEYMTSPYKDVVLEIKYKGKKITSGFLIEKGSEIIVVVGQGQGDAAQISLPNLLGKTIKEANLELGSKNFQLVTVFNCDDCKTAADSAALTIQQQSPEFVDGMTLSEGSEIVVILSK